MIRDVHPGYRIPDLDFLPILDPGSVPQHCAKPTS